MYIYIYIHVCRRLSEQPESTPVKAPSNSALDRLEKRLYEAKDIVLLVFVLYLLLLLGVVVGVRYY